MTHRSEPNGCLVATPSAVRIAPILLSLQRRHCVAEAAGFEPPDSESELGRRCAWQDWKRNLNPISPRRQ